MSEIPTVKRVLIIEDDREIAGVIAMNLESNGIITEQVHDGLEGLRQALSGSYDLIILDIMLPGLDGISVCRRIREIDTETPILMLTAKTEEIDLVLSLELGADDYMTKPFSMRELIARVNALIRRSNRTNLSKEAGNVTSDTLTTGDIHIDFSKHQVWLKGELLDLTVKEFELLRLFVRNPGRAYTRSDLLNSIWGYSFEGYEHTVNTHINRLRNKIEEDPSHPKRLITVWGIGYRFADNEEEPS
ncbi:MAG: response regulator transcription factor [Sphaerochaetaceae bacterium]